MRPITTAMAKATASSKSVSRSAAGTPLVCHTVPSESSTRDGGLMNSGSMNQRAAISQAIRSSATAPSRTTPRMPQQELAKRGVHIRRLPRASRNDTALLSSAAITTTKAM